MTAAALREVNEPATDRIWGKYPERKEQIAKLCKKIRPVVRFERVLLFFRHESADGVLYYIKSVDPFNIAFTWDAKPKWRARRLEKLADITTYHTWGYYGFFKPSIAEVLAQIPEEYLGQAVAFEIIERPESMDDLSDQWDIVNEGYHRATTRIYRRK